MAKMFRRIVVISEAVNRRSERRRNRRGLRHRHTLRFHLAVPEAKFGYTEVRIGFIPAIVSVFLIRQIGDKRARDLLLTGRILTAEEAKQIGLVNHIVEPAKLMDAARIYAASLVESSPIKHRTHKTSANRIRRRGSGRRPCACNRGKRQHPRYRGFPRRPLLVLRKAPADLAG